MYKNKESPSDLMITRVVWPPWFVVMVAVQGDFEKTSWGAGTSIIFEGAGGMPGWLALS